MGNAYLNIYYKIDNNLIFLGGLHMITVGITYMIMGSPYFLKDFLNLNVNRIWITINLQMFMSGLVILVAGLLNLAFPSKYWWLVFLAVMFLLVKRVMKISKQLMEEK
jgi:hypothetical protein